MQPILTKNKPRRVSPLLATLLCMLLVALNGCSPEPQNKGLEAVYDGDRYRIRLHQQGRQQILEVHDHLTQKTVIEAATSTLLTALKTQLEFNESHASFEHQASTSHRCQQARVDKAEPTSHYFLLAGSFQSPGCQLRFSLRFTQDEQLLRVVATTSNPEYNHLKLTLNAPRDETLLGFGAQVSEQNFKGLEVPVWIQEQGIGRGEQPLSTLIEANVAGASGHSLSSYFTVPHFVSSQGYSWFLENTSFSRFDFRNRQKLQIHSYSPTLKAQFSACSQLLDCVSNYTQYSGRMRALPQWTQKGAIVGLQGGAERVLKHYQALKQAGTPIAALWLQDWVGRRMTMNGTASQLWWNWERDPQLYADWKSLSAQLKTDNVRLLGYFNPFLVDVSEHPTAQRNLYQEALEKGYLVKDEQAEPYQIAITDFTAGLVDITNTEAFDWLKAIIKQQVKRNGFSGWMADFGEALPTQAVLANNNSALDFHNLFPQEWARLNAEVVRELGLQDEAVFFMRAGFNQSPSYASLFWLGDQNTNWSHHDGLQSAVIGLLNSGISGQSLNHADIGGYTSLRRDIPDAGAWLLPSDLTLSYESHDGKKSTQMALYRQQNLLMRWTEMSAFTAIFRTHEGLTPDINAQVYDTPVLRQHFARNAKLYQALATYRQQLMTEAEQKGWPLVRQPLLHYPQYRFFAQMPHEDLQFMLGEDIMVAPMLTPKNQRTQRNVFLPEGDWLDLIQGVRIEVGSKGKNLRISPPIGLAPAYIRINERSQSAIIAPLRAAGFVQ
jgi:alpha-glucosidase (family GH31 glycosyl hydrolase)